MKVLLILALGTFSFSLWSKSEVSKFNQTLLENVQKDIKQDEERYRKSSPMGRGPASVQEDSMNIEENKKLEKIRQIGPNKW